MSAIEERFDNATVERQETWTKFVISLIQKQIRCLDELAFVPEFVPIRYMNWIRGSQNDEPTGFIRLYVPELKANRFPTRLRVYGEAVSIQKIRKRQQIVVCFKCHGFHATRTYAQSTKCQNCGTDAHEGPCQKSPLCLNCRGPHSSTDTSCPARPKRVNRVHVRPTGTQLKQIRIAGKREFSKVTG
ncbi:hypothetical protein EPUL_003510 [Erysiphe pulchra]|uniref:Uncharacterized protein n=1 Tax=Erysiphe pulchra TaxID=225359 RepID=A0A2S4PSB9_9PEZI|nr:hypothetical protein EPUL_003510 [Erysiphe pulchra]